MHKLKNIKNWIMLIAFIAIISLFYSNIAWVDCYARTIITEIESKLDKEKIAGETFFEWIRTHSASRDKDILLKKEYITGRLDDLFRKKEAIRYIFDEKNNKRFPVLPHGLKHDIANLIPGFFEIPEGERFQYGQNKATIRVRVDGHFAILTFFKDPGLIKNADPAIGLEEKDVPTAKARGYWFELDENANKKAVPISLLHKGTAGDPIRVLLVMPRSPHHKSKSNRLPLGLMSLASCLRDESFLCKLGQNFGIKNIPNISVHIIDLQAEEEGFDLEKKLSEIAPDIIGVTAVTPLFNSASEIATLAHLTVPDAIRIIGGVHITAIARTPEKIDSAFIGSDFQIAAFREGEETLGEVILRLFNGEGLERINGIFYKDYQRGRLQIAGLENLSKRERLIPLEEYPLPAHSLDLLNLDGYQRLVNFEGEDRGIGAVLFTSRGCYYDCSFCASKSIFGRNVEFVSAGRIFEEIMFYYNNGFGSFYIMDDNFLSGREGQQRIVELAGLVEEAGIEIEYSALVRANSITEETANALRRSNCKVASIGVESADQKILDDVIGKKMKLKQVTRATGILKRHGIKVKYFFIVGLPGQNWESVKKTAQFILDNKPDLIQVSVAIPFPGTRLQREGGINIDRGCIDGYYHDARRIHITESESAVSTSTNVMNSEEITRARALLLDLFECIDNEGKVREIMGTIDSLCSEAYFNAGDPAPLNFYLKTDKRITSGDKAGFSDYMQEAWNKGLESGEVAYDPVKREELHLDNIHVYFVRGRAKRPGGKARHLPYRLGDKHKSEGCAFCRDRFQKDAVIANLAINNRRYGLALNNYPAEKYHFLLIKQDGQAEGGLSQSLQVVSELEDLLTLQRYLGSDYIQFFNYLPGDGESDGAATINHWHSHVMINLQGAFHSEFKAIEHLNFTNESLEGIKIGTLQNRFTNCRVFEGADISLISKYAFAFINILNRQKIACNLAVLQMNNGEFRVIVIPRKRGIPLAGIRGNRTFQRYGPSEMNGHLIESDPDAFNLMKELRPDIVRDGLIQRLGEIGFSDEELKRFDYEFILTPEIDEEDISRKLPIGFLISV